MVYVDGFNLYHGMREALYHRFYWLDIKKLAASFAKPDTDLLETKYFTASIAGGAPFDYSAYAASQNRKRQRQLDYLEALRTLTEFKLIFGKYQSQPKVCEFCGVGWSESNEKMTDVNIATELLLDAVDDRYDQAIIVSGDGDLVPPIIAIKLRFPQKRIAIAFPPKRKSKELIRVAHGTFNIREEAFRDCQLADNVTLPNGVIVTRPQKWTRQPPPAAS